MAGKIKCPVCGKYEFEEKDDFDICDVCWQENDEYQRQHPNKSGANHMSLNEAREAYKAGKKVR